jgi:hypothetical protein
MSKKKQKKRGKAPTWSGAGQVGTGANPEPRRWRAWLAGIAAAVLAGVVGGVITWVGPEVVDNAAAKDAVRDMVGGDDELRYTLQYLDPGYDLVLPDGVELTAQQETFLDNWNLDYQDPDGYTLDRLINDLRAAGGANPNELLLALTLEGRRNQPVHVDDIRPVDIRHSAPYSETFLNIPPQGPGETVKVMFNFDEVEPRARTAVDDGSGGYRPGGLFFQEQTLTIEDAKQDTIFIKSTATRWAVTFNIRIDYRIGDERNHLLINNDSRPFALTPMNCTDRSQIGADSSLVTSGHASYQRIWSLRGDFQGIERVSDSTHFEIGFPYC